VTFAMDCFETFAVATMNFVDVAAEGTVTDFGTVIVV